MKSIAKKFKLSRKQLMSLNPGIPKRPRVNTVIIVPNRGFKKTQAGGDGLQNDQYTVKGKDTWYGISKMFSISIKKLMQANPEVNQLSIGSMLTIPNRLVVDGNANGGSSFYLHKVKEDESIDSISRKFNISIAELLRINPELNEKDLAKGMELKVKLAEQDWENYQLHKVVKDDTIYNLIQKYNVLEEELYGWNPALIDGLKQDMSLRVRLLDNEKSKFVIHEVIKDDTIYSLCKNYEVSSDYLREVNPGLKLGLKLGMFLKVKLRDDYEGSGLEEDYQALEFQGSDQKIFKENIRRSKPLKVALMLPYHLQKFDNAKIDERFLKKNKLLRIVSDFHMGARIAIDSLQQKGIDVDVTYFDTENDTLKVKKIVEESRKFREAEVVIGPMFYDKAVWVSKETNTPVVAPFFSKKQDTLYSYRLTKSMPDQKSLQEKLINYLKANYNDEKIVIVNDGDEATETMLWQFYNQMITFAEEDNVSIIRPDEPKGNRKTNTVINYYKRKKELDKDSNNWVILLTDKIETTASALNVFKSFRTDKKITLFSMNDLKSFDQIDNFLLGKLNYTYVTSEYLDISSKPVKTFYSQYYHKYGTNPSKYSIRGFDVTYDILLRMASSLTYKQALRAGVSKRIAATFDYSKKMFGSTENKSVHLVQYNESLKPTILKVEIKKEEPSFLERFRFSGDR
jgi:LysM repeat protein/ABC-type branched-subunit amino acid transport system substrate-binding protein